MATALKRDPRLEVEVVEGHYGEYSVAVEGEKIVGGAFGLLGMLASVRKVQALVEQRLRAVPERPAPDGTRAG